VEVIILYCTNCGKQVQINHKFCQSCGTPVESLASSDSPDSPATANPVKPTPPDIPPPAESPASSYTETVKMVIPNLTISKSWGRSDTYNVIVTDRRSIFAKLTNPIMSETIKLRREKAAAEGKGFFGKWAAQMAGFNNYTERYSVLSPDQALNETGGNFAIDNASIRKVKVRLSSDEDSAEYEVEIITANEKLNFKARYDPSKMLKNIYGSIVS
jgi:hypothetical protein